MVSLVATVLSAPARADDVRLIEEPSCDWRESEPLVGGSFEVPGFRLEGVPEGVRIVRVRLAPLTWEVQQENGRRIALIQQVAWADLRTPVAVPTGDASLVFLESRLEQPDNWGGRRVPILVERVSDDRYVYLVERLTEGSEWIWQRWRSVLPAPP